MGARVYNPKNGRFLSVDPILDALHTTTLNGYSYTGADPINASDPSGLVVPRFKQIPESGNLYTDNGKNVPRADKREILDRYTRPEPSLKERQEKEVEMHNSTVVGSAISILMIGGVGSFWLSDEYDRAAINHYGPYLGNQYAEIRASHEIGALILSLGKSSVRLLRSRSIARAVRPVAPPKPARSLGLFTRDQLLKAAQVPDKGDQTAIGRALQKHSGRADSVLKDYETLTKPAERDEAGLKILERILDDPNGKTTVLNNVTEYYDSAGLGVRYRNNGDFMGFLEPSK